MFPNSAHCTVVSVYSYNPADEGTCAKLVYVLPIVGVIVNENADAAANDSTLTSMAVLSSTASAVSSVASSTGYAGTTQTPSVSTSAPLPCQHDRWLVSFKEDPQQYCIIMQADISVTIYAENKHEV